MISTRKVLQIHRFVSRAIDPPPLHDHPGYDSNPRLDHHARAAKPNQVGGLSLYLCQRG